MLNEEGLELMTIDMLKDLGYEYEPGETIGRDYSDVILEPNLTMSLYKINRNLKDETIAEAYHDWYLNKQKATDASKAIVTVLKKYINN